MKTFALILTAFLFSYTTACAQPGILDGDFDADGKVTTNVAVDRYERASALLVQPDSKIIAVGYARGNTTAYDIAVVRYNIDGSLDNSFSVNGMLTTDVADNNDYGYDAALQADGKIVVVGTTGMSPRRMIAVRYNADGTLDGSFGTNGMVILDSPETENFTGEGIVIQPDGKICLAGRAFLSSSLFLVARLNTDGSLDNTFSVDGILTSTFGDGTSSAYAIALQTDGKIVVAGDLSWWEGPILMRHLAVARFNTDGTLDMEFDTDGRVLVSFGSSGFFCRDMTIQNDGKIVLVGYSNNSFALARLNTDASIDNTFSVDGRVITAIGIDESYGRAIAIQADNKILAAGNTSNTAIGEEEFALVRYNSDGTLDNTFSLDGRTTIEFGNNDASAYSVAIQPNGRIVVGGISRDVSSSEFAVARFISGVNIGILDFAVDNGSVVVYPNPIEENSILKYQLEKDEVLSCHVYDMNGKLVQTLFSSQKRQRGQHTEALGTASALPSGNYLLQLDNGTDSFSLKVTRP
ncbi:MAG: T9SS type A sorting domain-containing protein [Flavobacteriales bacterium]